MNRYVIALNRLKIVQKQLKRHEKLGDNSHLSVYEVSELMDFVRKYPKEKIQQDKLFTCGFSKN